MTLPSQPPRLVQAVTVLIGVLLAFNIVYDALNKGYEGYEVTFGLMTLLGGLLGIHRVTRGGDDR